MYMYIYTYTHIPSLGSWRAIHAFFAKEVIKLCPQNIYNYKNVPVKVLNRKYDSLCVLAVICQLGAIGVLQWQLMLFFWGILFYFFAFWPLFYKSAPVLFQDWAMPLALSPPYFINIMWLGIKMYSVSEPTAVEQRSSSTGWHFFFF